MKQLVTMLMVCFAVPQLYSQCTGTKILNTSTTYTSVDQATIDGWFLSNDLIRIPNNTTITMIGCTLKVRLSSTVVEIMQGGRLIMQDCRVQLGAQKATCNTGPSFEGFAVKGTNTSDQYLWRHSPFDPTNTADFTNVGRYHPDQGVLIMTGCTVMGTEKGDNGTSATITSTQGGCVELFDCTFTDNYNCINLKNYNRVSSTDLEAYNAFNIINCTFQTTTNRSLHTIGTFFINLDRVQRVQIEGCEFLNNLSYSSNSFSSRVVNTGISYTSSTFSIQRSGFDRTEANLEMETNCPEYGLPFTRKNKFKGLPFGISSQSGGFNDKEFVIADCEFEECLMGIHALRGLGGTIVRNSYSFKDAHEYEAFLLDEFDLESDGAKDDIYFIAIENSEKIVVSENRGEIFADDFKINSTINSDLDAAFVVVKGLMPLGVMQNQINIYRNASRGFTNYLGETVNGGFICSGSRTAAHKTYGVLVTSLASGSKDPFLNINCNDFATLSDPILFDYVSGVGDLNGTEFLQNNGLKASMNEFVACTDPAVVSNGQTIKYRFLSTDPDHDPGTVGGNVSKKSTTSSFDCGGLACVAVSWGTGVYNTENHSGNGVLVFPNPAYGQAMVQWQLEEGYEGTYYVDLYTVVGKHIGTYSTSGDRLNLPLPEMSEQLLIGTLRTENNVMATFKLRTTR